MRLQKKTSIWISTDVIRFVFGGGSEAGVEWYIAIVIRAFCYANGKKSVRGRSIKLF